jgi:ABC-2 type transport system permease protein
MKGIILAKLSLFIRKPGTFLLFTGMSIIFTLIIGNSGGYDQINVPVTGDKSLETGKIGEALEENDVYHFSWQSQEEMEESIRRGNAEAGIILEENGYEVVAGIESPNVRLMEQTIAEIYTELREEENILKLIEGESEIDQEEFLTSFKEAKENPVFSVSNESFHTSDSFIFNQSLHSIFGFTLFFLIYTIAYNVLPILTDRSDGIWDRMILSPLKRWEMYVGNLVYSFFVGYLQVLVIFLVFRYIVGLDFKGEFLGILAIMFVYTFTIVALSIFTTALVKNTQQFNAVLPILSVSMAMIGGAFWPIEIVQSDLLIGLSKLNPLTYGMEALNGLVLYELPLEELLMPISILVLMGVVFMGVGIHLMERRYI